MTKSRTPTETLVSALEEFGQDEPRECIVISATQSGDLVMNASTDCLSTKLGLVETAAEHIRCDIRKLRGVEE